MKKLLLLLFSLFFLSSPSVFAENFIYHCNFDIYFKNFDDNQWTNKYNKLTYSSNNNKTISIFNHGINITYPFSLIIKSQNPHLVAEYQDSIAFRTLVIDRENNYGTYAVSYTDGKTHGEYGIGECKLQ